MSIAVTGATGQLGRIVIEKLKQRTATSSILALARKPEQAESLGVVARAFDYSEAEMQDAALSGVGTLLLISSSEIGQRAAQHTNVIAAAKRAGVRRVVYTSVLHADVSVLALADEHRATEAALKASGLPYTLLRNGWYTENYTGFVGMALANGALLGSAGAGQISSATREDLAEAAAVVLTAEGHENMTYELVGDTSWTLSDLTAEISRQSGKDIRYRDLPEAEYAAVLEGAGLPRGLAAALASYDASASQGALYGNERDLTELIGRSTTTLFVSVERALAAL